METLRVRGLSRSFGTTTVLSGLDLEVTGGDFLSLLGPSGCGKTTALNCIGGLLTPDAGTVELDGQDITRLAPERRRFGMVFQSYALFPHLTVGGNVAFGLQMQGVPRAEIGPRVVESLRLVHLEHLAGQHPAQLSGGQQQRVALARALVTEPRLMLMDEPLSNLDAGLRQEMRIEIRRLHLSLGLTTLFVTHDREEALSLSDRVAVLRDGSIEQLGTPEEVSEEPASAYVAGFMGYRNLLRAGVESVAANQVVLRLEGGVELAGRPRAPLTPGAQAVVALRPEDVEVGPEGGAEGGPAARVEVVEFLGRDFEVGVRLDGGTRVVARSQRRLNLGEEVTLRVPPERALVFPEA
ncbi:MAG: ABC transporter ATP-binding protein [Candidatus Dormibacteraeota bacterium]|nr:ABC transporter ATP-binding protein [Candidatus Dormibacteraeota bacterium]